MKNIAAFMAVTMCFGSLSRAHSDDSEYISQLGYATTMVPVVITFLPVAPTIFSFVLTFSPDSIARKVILDAQEDFTYFIASEGAVKTAKFEQAVKYLRQFPEISPLSDFEIAQGALGFQ